MLPALSIDIQTYAEIIVYLKKKWLDKSFGTVIILLLRMFGPYKSIVKEGGRNWQIQ